LSETQRETVLLVNGQAYANAEAAALLGIPLGKPARPQRVRTWELEAEAFLFG
jgi:hypothetical protein